MNTQQADAFFDLLPNILSMYVFVPISVVSFSFCKKTWHVFDCNIVFHVYIKFCVNISNLLFSVSQESILKDFLMITRNIEKLCHLYDTNTRLKFQTCMRSNTPQVQIIQTRVRSDTPQVQIIRKSIHPSSGHHTATTKQRLYEYTTSHFL